MIALTGSRRVARCLALCVVFLISSCTEFATHVGLILPPRALAAQNQIPTDSNNRRPEKKGQHGEDQDSTRPRRADQPQDPDRNQTPKGPVIRVALMTDVSSLSLGSSSSLSLRYSVGEKIQSKNIANGPLTVELRQQREELAPVVSSRTTYRVSVGSSSESRAARKLLDELKKAFFEPASINFNEKEKYYSVLIGEFSNRQEASSFLERLRKSGYESLRLITESKTTDDPSSGALADTNARAAKYKAEEGSKSTRRSMPGPAHRVTELVAIAASKVTASSSDEFVISPVYDKASVENSTLAAEGSDKNEKQVLRRSQTDGLAYDADTLPASSAISIGNKKYRGDIHLILNPRGRINVVNALPLEDYLRGVVPMELSPVAFPEIEALKAQAVAARSYALAHLGRHDDEGFDLVDDTRDQVYRGLSAEREMTNRAIAETRGIAAVFQDDRGELAPIEALYTANCGGRTENNEEVFGGKPLSYLRAVACAPDRKTFGGSDIVTSRTREPLIGMDGRSMSREIALLSVCGFSLPRRVTNTYLGHPADLDEMKSWLEKLARLSEKDAPTFIQKDVPRLAEFIQLLALAVYGKGRANTLLAPADIDYLLSGFPLVQLPIATRADAALLLKDGIFRIPADGMLDGRSLVTRGQALECVARAILKISRPNNASIQSAESRANPSFNSMTLLFKSDTSVQSDSGRLVLASSTSVRDGVRNPRFTSINTAGTGRIGKTQTDPANIKSESTSKREAATEERPVGDGSRSLNAEGLEIFEFAWLFRTVGGESQEVDRLMIIGGERVTYHLNTKGQVDFLEASISDRSASSDRFSNVSQWQERISIDEIQQRLERAHIKVGRVERIEPISFSSSSRVTQVEVTGNEGSYRLRRPNIRALLGLKEYLFVVDREMDSHGKVVGFVFTGRGWGHGVGMCQIGAYGLAKEGYSYSDILKKYYTGITLQKRY
jgi:peptidoglycan hydrolase-like amidase